jgi:lipopolysaccharide transport system permease protein
MSYLSLPRRIITMVKASGQIPLPKMKNKIIATGNASSESLVTRIRPSHGWVSINIADLWRYRELVYFLVWRDTKVRYKQTALGAAWALLQPLLAMMVFSVFFGRLAKIPSDGLPYPLFCYVALVPWTFFSNALTQASNSLVGSANLISKVYFPRLAMPISAVLAGLIDFGIALLLIVGMMTYYNVSPTWSVLQFVPFLMLGIISALGAGFWLSALNIEYRDVRYAVPFLVQIWMFATPIAYPSSLVPERWRSLYALNPMVVVVEGFRSSLLRTLPQPTSSIVVAVLMALILFFSGAYYFRRTERIFADVV